VKRFLAYLLIFFSLLGVFDTGYLTWEKLNNSIPPCSAAFKCGDVLNSSWASVGHIPLSAFGILFYTGFLLLGSLLFIEKEKLQVGSVSVAVSTIALVFGILGVLFSAYFVFLMGVVLQAWCLYCVLSALNCVVLFVTSLFIYIHAKKGIQQ
jgi:uncharacterized membrane protein